MSKFTKIITLLTTCLILTSCNNNGSTSSTSEVVQSSWSDEGKQLLETYAGEVLPYPSNMLVGDVDYYVGNYSSSVKVLQISDQAESFTLKNYYYDLVADGWALTKGYNGNVLSTDSNGASYVELTKYNQISKTAHMIWYFFDAGKEADEESGTEGYHSCNIIWCFNSLATSSKEGDWNEDDKAKMQDVLTFTVPNLEVGNDYYIVQTNTNSLVIRDTYYKNCVSDAVSILKDEGYVLDEALSKSTDCYTLRKKNIDGSSYVAQLSYASGNYFTFIYLPTFINVTSWPSDVVKIIDDQTSTDVPSFIATSFHYWIKNNNTMYIYVNGSETSETIDVEYANTLLKSGFISTDGYYINWEEDVIINFDVSYLDDGSIDTFGILISVCEPVSKFSNGWPTQQLKSFYESNNINIEVPSPNFKEDVKPLKYESSINYAENYKYYYDYIMENGFWMDIDTSDEALVKKEATKYAKEATGVFLTIYDPDESICDSYIQQLYELKWHRSSNNYGGYTYEDNDGSVAVFIGSYKLQTIVKIYLGSGEKHQEVFEFLDKRLVLGLGDKVNSNLIKDIYPYAVSFTSSNPDYVSVDQLGNLSVSKTATIGSEVTITASMVDDNGEIISTSMVVVVAERVTYTEINAVDRVANLYNSYFGYTNRDTGYVSSGHDEMGNYFSTKSPSSDVEETKLFISENLVPYGFTTSMTEWKYVRYQNSPTHYIDYTCDGITLRYRIMVISSDFLLMNIDAFVTPE